MKTSIRNLILAGVTGVSLISASVALAGGPGGCGGGNFGPGYSNHGPGMMMGHGWGGPRHAAFSPEEMASNQMEMLKKSLKLQADQEKPWNAFAGSVEAQAKRMGEMFDEKSDSAKTMPERMDMASKFAKERERSFEEVSKAMKGLYEVLTPEQRKVFDRRGPWMRG
ncbi:MAG: hypothetical protein FD131_839 [Rhodocyclaceae bacterium]|nr:MAG: hypothetical protein FD131_839 [Rhodocyclaceae bacterium]